METHKHLGTVLLPGSYDPITTGHINSLRFLSERSEQVYAVIMTHVSDEGKRWIPSIVMKNLVEAALKAEGLNNVGVYIEAEDWIAHTIDVLKADCVARSFHPNIIIEKEMDFINSVIELDILVQIIPSKLNLRASNIKWFYDEGMLEDFKEQLPQNVYQYITTMTKSKDSK